DIALALAALDAVERRLSDEDVAALNEFLHVAEEEGEQQGADVRAVHVGVGHQNDFVIAEFAGVEIVLSDAGAARGDDGTDFLVAEHLVVAGLFDVEDFALEGKNGLIFAVSALLGGAASGLALDDEELAAGGITLLAVRELAGEAARIHRGLAPSELAGLAGG